MITFLIAWLIIFFILFSFGDLTICVFNKFCKCSQKYNFLDTFLIGLCTVLIPISINSFWFPTNHCTLAILIFFSVLYWVINKRRFIERYNKVKGIIHELSYISLVLLVLAAISFSYSVSWATAGFDQYYYHYSNILWNSEFSVIPGLANLEDRFGFNSNYLLISALFTPCCLLDTIIFPLQSLLFILVYCWIVLEIVRSGYNWSALILLPAIIILYIVCQLYFSDSDTDIIPILCTFYLLAKVIVYHRWHFDLILLSSLLPVALITFKLSSAIYAILSLIVLIHLIKQKQYRQFFFITSSLFLILSVWFIRNIYVSGYLVYPICQIDIFDVDWKLPRLTALLQLEYIGDWGRVVLNNFFDSIATFDYNVNIVTFLRNVLQYALFMGALLSPVAMIVAKVRKRKINKEVYLFYLIALFSIVFWFLSAPDPRFIYGALLGCILISVYSSIAFSKSKSISSNRKIYAMCRMCYLAGVLMFIYFTYKKSHESLDLIHHYSQKNKLEIMKDIAIKPRRAWLLIDAIQNFEKNRYNFTHTDQNEVKLIDRKSEFLLHSSDTLGLPSASFCGGKVQDIRTIEFRGDEIKDGFRTKPEYIDSLNKNIDVYMEEYKKCLKQRTQN